MLIVPLDLQSSVYYFKSDASLSVLVPFWDLLPLLNEEKIDLSLGNLNIEVIINPL